MVIATILGALGSLYLKMGSKQLDKRLRGLINKSLITGLILFVISALMVIIALKFGELSKVFPLTALTYIWIALFSWKVLKERVTREKLMAFILIIIGIILVTS